MIKPINKNLQSLKVKSQPASIDDRQVAQDLLDTLEAHQVECVGMAANMIGMHKRIIAVSLGPINIAMLNPEITQKSQPYQTEEGCLSLTGKRSTTRYQKITVHYIDLTGESQSLNLTNFAAEIVQHEIDHCNGIII
ncbi:peptide deformylase [Lactobacillus alvi]|uniref:Peptide deformylase n=1 Tax=Limosilactobacillus alvi TaxID=990412 RepID=A0ABS2EQU8_9LACO|nr:peptide deformylase [Limosilactobacillus alvi]MBM6754768.1 peptide deformylase [Limosilactobacillus alvi]